MYIHKLNYIYTVYAYVHIVRTRSYTNNRILNEKVQVESTAN